MTTTYTFTEEEAKVAFDEWGCNCGPTALAFALQTTLDAARHAIKDFEAKRYTSPTMMKGALEFLKRRFVQGPVPARPKNVQTPVDIEHLFSPWMALVRIQWTGPWTDPGANPKWAYRQTHWIATWTERDVPLLFDCNGGIRGPMTWEEEIVPLLTASVPRADGGWFPTHNWRLVK